MKKLTLTLAIATSAVMTGCTSMQNKSASETFKHSLNAFHEDSYNFTVTQKLRLTPSKTTANPTSDKLADYKPNIGIADAGYKPILNAESTDLKVADDSDAAIEAAEDASYTEATAVAEAVEDATEAVAATATAEVVERYDECDDEFGKALDSGVTIEVAEEAYLNCLSTTADSVQNNDDEENPNSVKSTVEKLADKKDKLKNVLSPERINAIDTYWLKPFQTRIDGALDSNAKKLQIIYTSEYQSKNIGLSMSFPMLFNLNEMSITLDPALAMPVLAPVFAEETSGWEGKSVKFFLPEEFKKEIPTDIVLSALTKSLIKSHDNLPDSSFQYIASDDFAKKVNANKVVKVDMNIKQQISLFSSFINNWVNEIDKQVQANPEQVADMKNFKDLLNMAIGATSEGLLSEENIAEVTENAEMLDMLGTFDSRYYFDNSGRMRAGVVVNKLNALADIINADIISTGEFTMSNINKVKFSYDPSPSEVIDGNALLKKAGILGKDTKKNEDK